MVPPALEGEPGFFRPPSGSGRAALRRAALLGGIAALLGGACGSEGAPRATAAPNVLLISIDTLRADHLPFHGYGRDTAPRLARLAQAGIVFENATASSSWTLPSHLSMLTGLSVSAHGVCDDRLWTRRDAAGAARPVPLRGTFVSERLAHAGYRCAGFYSWKYLDDQFGFGPGFETWERLGHTFYSHPVVAPEFERLRAAGDIEGMQALAARHPKLFDDTAPSSPEVIERSLQWLDAHETRGDEEPFFLFVHLFDVHDPYAPPPPYRDLFDPDYEGPIDGRRVAAPDSPVRGDMDPRDLEHLIALYDGGIAWVDAQIGRLLDGLEARGLARDTLIVVTADHGEEFFEHGHKTHRRQVYRESVHVPLVVVWPERVDPGQRVDTPVGLVDIAPTLCAAAGLAGQGGMEGVDLLSLARAAHGDTTRAAELFVFPSEAQAPSEAQNTSEAQANGAAFPERHLGLSFGREYAVRVTRGTGEVRWESFDLTADPRGAGAARLLDANGPEVRALERRVGDLRASVTRLREDLPARGDDLAPLNEHDLAQLAAMGYAGQGEATDAAPTDERLCVDGCVWCAPD